MKSKIDNFFLKKFLSFLKNYFYVFFSALKLSNYYSSYRPGINEKQSQNKVRQISKSQKFF